MIEKVYTFDNHYSPSAEMLPVRQQQAYDDILKLEKEFASEIYIQRDREKYL